MSEPRTLRRKRLRTALFIAADGRCQSCGDELQGGWHADHTIPWRDRPVTNVCEMQALCPKCNLQKGTNRMSEFKPRKHQVAMVARANDVVEDPKNRSTTLADVTPGGGKTRGAAMFAQVLFDANQIDAVCFVSPRESLAVQGEGDYSQHLCPTRKNDNTPPILKSGARAYTTTIQSVAANPDLHLHEFRTKRYLLVVDEFHHCADDDGKAWTRAIAPLVDQSVHALFMTGTPERSDGKRLPFVEDRYETGEDGRDRLKADIQYSLQDALAENAVIRAEFHVRDADLNWIDDDGEKTARLSTVAKKDRSKAKSLAIVKGWEDIVRDGLTDYIAYRGRYAPNAQAIVIAGDQREAKKIAKFIQSEFGEVAALAISNESQGTRRLKRFRENDGAKILVTVGMAYEGLDAPECSHLVLLTFVRSKGWLMQAVARATRVAKLTSKEPKNQCAHIYGPKDADLLDFVAWMDAQQQAGIEEREAEEKKANERSEGDSSLFIPLSADMHDPSIVTSSGAPNDEEQRIVRAWRQRFPDIVAGFSHEDILQLASFSSDAPRPSSGARKVSISEREKQLRLAIDKVVKSLDYTLGQDFGTTNKRLYKIYGERKRMGIGELEHALDTVRGWHTRAVG